MSFRASIMVIWSETKGLNPEFLFLWLWENLTQYKITLYATSRDVLWLLTLALSWNRDASLLHTIWTYKHDWQTWPIQKFRASLQNLCWFFVKSKNQGHFQNPHNKLISKLLLHARFGQELTEYLKVKE